MTIKNKLQQRSQQELIAFINHYRANGLNMIPVKAGDKKPYVPWEQYQKRKSTQKEIEQWFLSGAGFNIGIVCGQISGGLVVVDIDAGTPRKAVNKARKIFGSDRLQHTFVVKTSKGVHVYWKVRQPVSTTHFRDIGVDLQAEGAYVLAPPSLHPSGTKYQCESLVNVAEWTEGDFMEELLEGLQRAYGKKFDAESYRQPVDVARLLKGVPKGERNVACIQLATWHRTKGKSKEETLKLMLEWNKCNEEPLPEKEVRRTVESAYKKKEPYKYKFIEVTEEVFPEEVHKEAEQLLKQPNIIPAILSGRRKQQNQHFPPQPSRRKLRRQRRVGQRQKHACRSSAQPVPQRQLDQNDSSQRQSVKVSEAGANPLLCRTKSLPKPRSRRKHNGIRH